MGLVPYNRELKERSRQLRENMTPAERVLWARIRSRQIRGLQFHRQKPVGEYIVDFYCHRAMVVIEIDGSQHSSREVAEADKARDEYMAGLGLKVLRFTNDEVLKDIDGVAERITQSLADGG